MNYNNNKITKENKNKKYYIHKVIHLNFYIMFIFCWHCEHMENESIISIIILYLFIFFFQID